MLLKKFYDRGLHRGAGFLMLYGRKGVGKTRLLERFLQEEAITDYFYWQVSPGEAATQLQEFSQTLLLYDLGQSGPPSPAFTFFSWHKALDYLSQIAQRSEKTRLFIVGLIKVMHRLPQAKIKGWRVRLIVFGQRSFTAAVRAAAAAGVCLVTLAEIEPLLLMAREARRRQQDSSVSEPFEF